MVNIIEGIHRELRAISFFLKESKSINSRRNNIGKMKE